MNITKIAQFTEIVSGIAVLVTLVFLYIEVRENSAVIRASSYTQSTAMINEWRYQGANNPELTRLFRAFMNGETNTFNEIEAQQFSFFIGALWGVYESSYYSKGYGILGEQEWRRFETQACLQYQKGLPQGFWPHMRSLVSEEFYTYVETHCVE
jgi:hypothetical protein